MMQSFSSIKNKWIIAYSILAIVFLFLFIISFQISIFYPIYGDELEWKLISSRFFIDQNKLIYLFPWCENSLLLDIPLSWYPGRILDSLIYQGSHSSSQLRNLGVVQYLIIVFLIWKITVLQTKLTNTQSFLFVISFLSLGLMPILSIFNRPEQPLLIYLCLSLYLVVQQTHKPCRILGNKIFVTLIFCVLTNLIITTHPKGIYLIPIVLIAYRQINKSFFYFFVYLAVTCWTTFQTIQVWSARTACVESPWLEALLRSMTLSPGNLFTDPVLFAQQVVKNCIRFYSYINSILFSTDYQSQWLPSLNLSILKTYSLAIINVLIWLSLIVTFSFICFRFLKIKVKNDRLYISITTALAFSIVLITVMQIGKNFYESSLIYPLLLLLCIFLINPKDQLSQKFIGNVAIPILLVVGSFSSYERFTLFSEYLPLWKSSSNARVVDQVKAQEFVSQQCGIDDNAKGLVLAHSTYPVFWRHSQPVLLSYLNGWYATGTDYKETLRNLDSDGVIAMCAELPVELRDVSKEGSGVCCVSKARLKQLIEQ